MNKFCFFGSHWADYNFVLQKTNPILCICNKILKLLAEFFWIFKKIAGSLEQYETQHPVENYKTASIN